MKKVITFICAFTIGFTLCACDSNKKPDDISDDHYRIGLKALEIVDDYLGREITAKEAQRKMTDLANDAGGLDETSIDDQNHLRNDTVVFSVTLLSNELLMADISTATDKDILPLRNDIAKAVNQKLR